MLVRPLNRCWCLLENKKKIFSTPVIENSSLVFQSVAWLLYQLSYPGSKEIMKDGKKENKHKFQKYLFSAIPLKTKLDLLSYASPIDH